MADFLKSIGRQINSQYGVGQNTPQGLATADSDNPDQITLYGALGDFASQIDQTAQRKYIESGYIRNIKPRYFETLHQTPDITVVVKKQIFSSLVENYRTDYMDQSERLFMKAAKRLFQNKAQIISIYEKLSKIDKIVESKGSFDDYLMPIVLSGVDTLESLGALNNISSKTKKALDTLRKLNNYSTTNNFTTWIQDRNSFAVNPTGSGTGVIEFTMMSSVNTTNSVKFNGGECSITFEDPYNLMRISEQDIDKAISESVSVRNNTFASIAERELSKIINDLTQRLNKERRARNVPLINVKTSQDSLLYKRVSAYIDGVGEIIFNYDPGFLGLSISGGGISNGEVQFDPSASNGNSGLNDSEKNLLSQILKNTFTWLNQQKSQQTSLEDLDIDRDPDLGKNISYVRKKMRLYFANKHIIQCMDSVHIYMSSKTKVDDIIKGVRSPAELAGGGKNLLSMIDSTMGNIQSLWDTGLNFFGTGNKESFSELEKNAIVGADFPTWLWTLLRNDFTRQAAGVHTFAGYVRSVNSSYRDGKYTIGISCTDNAGYFSLSQINTQPSVDVVEEELYNPLTPFDIEYDASSGFLKGNTPNLLPENKKIFYSGLVKAKNGPRYRGAVLTDWLYSSIDGTRVDADPPYNFKRIFYDPDGFVYKWKQGIGSLIFLGPRHNDLLRKGRQPSVTRDAFAGQDVINVLSLLVTGQPYNFNTFLKGAIAVGNLSRNDLVNQSSSTPFYRGLLSDLQRNNILWGGFVPFKKLTMGSNEKFGYLSAQFDVTEYNYKINDLMARRAKLFDSLIMSPDGKDYASNPVPYTLDESGLVSNATATAASDGTGTSSAVSSTNVAIEQIKRLDVQLSGLLVQVRNKISESNIGDGSLQYFGNDISIEPEMDSSGVSGLDPAERSRAELNLHKRLKSLTLRRLWNVKANEDTNLFIIDDQYDNNYDIQAFSKQLQDKLKTFNSDYSDPKTQIETVSGLLGLEIFANTQGHIQCGPPGYNKIPSSVFQRMLKDKNNGKKIFPEALEDLFLTQSDDLIERLEIIEDEIRLKTTALGLKDDHTAASFLSGSNNSSVSRKNSNYQFSFISDFAEGKVNKNSLKSLVQQSLPDLRKGLEAKPLKTLQTKIKGQVSRTALFDAQARASLVFSNQIFNVTELRDIGRFDKIKQRLELKTGTKGPTIQDIFSTNRTPFDSSGATIKQSDILKVVNDLSALISNRQAILNKLYNSLKNLDDGLRLNNDPDTGRSALFPNLNKSEEIPTIIRHMIEDENTDDIGEGSGSRYIIKDSQIISLDIREQPPEFTAIQVNGLFGEGYASAPAGLEVVNGGNGATSAASVDYDMWRMYGFRLKNGISAPYLSDPQSQIAPLTVWKLTEQRKKILSGSVSITGNEYMQQGEVVYIESLDLLFYVDSVAHSFSYDGSFTTTLSLTYGRNPGEYFPTMLDIVGKSLYSKRAISNLTKHERSDSADGYQSVGVVIADSRTYLTFGTQEKLFGGTYGQQNMKSLTDVLLLINRSSLGVGATPIVQLRVYKNSAKGISTNRNVLEMANDIKNWFKSPSESGNVTLGDAFKLDKSTIPNPNIDNFVKIVEVDNLDPFGPSRIAWSTAKDIVQSGSFGSQDVISNRLPEENILYSNIIDIWIGFEAVDTTISTDRTTKALSQSSEDEAEILSTLRTITGRTK